MNENLSYPIGKFNTNDPRWNISVNQTISYLASYPEELWDLIEPLTDDQMETPYRPSGWTITQLVHHIADSHANAYIRFKLALTEDDPTIKPYREAIWALLPDNPLELIGTSIGMLRAIHARWTYLMAHMTDDDWSRRYYHPDDEEYVELYTARKIYHWHSAHHYAHISALITRENW